MIFTVCKAIDPWLVRIFTAGRIFEARIGIGSRIVFRPSKDWGIEIKGLCRICDFKPQSRDLSFLLKHRSLSERDINYSKIIHIANDKSAMTTNTSFFAINRLV